MPSAEPWLDSLSEDWKSPTPSSPSSRGYASTCNTSRRISNISSQSRIPHLAHNIRNASSGGSFLKPRSARGIARLRENNALVEKTPSSLNAGPQLPADSSKENPSSAAPRRASSVLSDSQTSVQHHTIDKTSQLQDTPEWKRRLRDADNVDSDGFDLFSPSKLEGIFKQSSCPVDENDEKDASVIVIENKPWNSLSDAAFPAPSTSFRSRRASKGRLPGMDTLQEVDEEREGSYDLSAIPSEIVRRSKIKGIVKRGVSNLELADATNARQTSLPRGQDPRMRTISGRKEISDEIFSPVEDGEKSSIRKQALQDSLENDPIQLRRKLTEAQSQSRRRSRSRSSDHDISYDADGLNEAEQPTLPEEHAVEITSHSLPEDLSMGTQNCGVDSVLIAGRRPPNHVESSFICRKPTVTAADTSQLENPKAFRSSPPPYRLDHADQSKAGISEPTSPVETSVLRHGPTSTQHSNATSPLKLFGNRDTYTNNKLMRVLSQYEDEDSKLDAPEDAAAFRMSNFGRGELDDFGFDKQVERPVIEQTKLQEGTNRLFTDPALLSTNDDKLEHEGNEPSHVKERSPKRRRTLLKDELFVDGAETQVKVSQMPENHLAGKKRRDALPGKDAEQASPDTLALRSILRPSGSRRSSGNGHERATSASEALHNVTESAPQLTEQLTTELESFAQNAAEVKQDSRKASLATKDYMEEANKVMEFIRARGKPRPPLPEIVEPEDVSELNPDAILDLEVEDSTKDSFSRPPSREGRAAPQHNRRHAQHDAATADHLKRFHETDDLELLTSTSALGTWPAADNKAVEQAALVPVPEDKQQEIEESMQSDPPGMRILNENDKKRKHSSTETDNHESHSSENMNSEGSGRTVATSSSSSSGHRGMISQGTVSIPDTIGGMAFDHEKQIWVKRNGKPAKMSATNLSPESKSQRQEHSEADPFAGIPDLSVDESKEASWKKSPLQKVRKTNTQAAADGDNAVESDQPRNTTPAKSSLKPPRRQPLSDNELRSRLRDSQVSAHEVRLHDGLPSEEVNTSAKQQPRVVTIAFSSPIASEIPYVQPPSISDVDLDDDDPSMLPLDDEGSVLDSSPAKPPKDVVLEERYSDNVRPRTIMGSLERHEQYRAMTLNRRPISRIEEHDEEVEDTQELSLVHIKHAELTPMPERQVSLTRASAGKESSILCLTPLSEFTLHQADKLNHPEESFVADRANPKALRQAHGSAALVEDALVKAITDAEPSELFWEQLRRLSLTNSGLAALHGLQDYCTALEQLDVSGNEIGQLNGLPSSLRSLNISSNVVNDLTSWTHLHNLQLIDVSGNQLESLECFSSLIHLRQLNASNNKIRNIEGIFDLNGLITLDLSGNDIPDVDFYNCGLTVLEKLDLSKNNLMHAKNLDCLPKLKIVDFTDNLLEELTVREEKVVSELETLCVARNELSVLDLTAFPSLQRLNVDGNMIVAFPGLAQAERLTVLSAREQRVVSDLVNTILTSSHECVELYLSRNAIPESGLTLSSSPNFTLRGLELASCGLQRLPAGFGDMFPNIRVLNVNYNALSDLAPLQGMVKLKHLYMAKNRIKKMRRTCLTLSRLPILEKVDVRDNPLTIGFYAPDNGSERAATGNRASNGSLEQDRKWLGLMDETTWLRRRAMELLMAECCKALKELDGFRFDQAVLMKEQSAWQRLMGRGVLQREKETTVTVSETVKGREQPVDEA